MKQRFESLLFTAGVIALLALGFWLGKYSTEDKHRTALEYWEKKGFKTDTVHVEVDYSKLPIPRFEYKVPPAQIRHYPVPVKDTQFIKITLDDSLLHVIDSLKGTIIAINERYIKFMPKAHKLLYGEFDGDSLQLDVLTIDGKIETQIWGVNYDKFIYQYVDGSLKAQPIKSNTKSLDYALYGNAGVLFYTDRAAFIGLEGNLYKKRFKLGGELNLTLDKTPQPLLKTSLGYKLNR